MIDPWWLIGIGVLCLIGAVYTLLRQRRKLTAMPDSNATITLPATWDERFISSQIDRYHQQPALLAHFVYSIRERLIVGQDNRTEQARTRFLQARLEQYKLAKELMGVINDLKLMDVEREIRQLELENRKSQLQEDRDTQQLLVKLRQQRDALKIRLETAQLQQQMGDLKEKPEPKLSADQQRRLKRMEIEDKLRELDRREEEALRSARSEEDRMRIKNMHAHKREQLSEQLSQFLV